MKLFKASEHTPILDELIQGKVMDMLRRGEKLPKLGIVLLGNDPTSEKYIALKQNFCTKLGLVAKVLRLNESDTSMEVTIAKFIKQMNGVIIQLPLPNWAGKNLIQLIPQEKDIDSLNSNSCFASPVVRAFDYFLKWTGVEYTGKNAVVVGNGDLIGRPITEYLKQKQVEIKVLDDYKTGTKIDSDLLVSGVGIPGLIESKDISEGCNCVDFGSALIEGKTKGDIAFGTDYCEASHLSYIAPSPLGLGPIVIRFLIMNLLKI